MQALNFVYFAILTFFEVKYLFSTDGATLRSPLDKEDYCRFTGQEMFWILLFSTGFLAFSYNVGLDLMALRLLVLEILLLVAIPTSEHRPVWTPGLIIYVIYLLWLAIGLLYSPSAAYGVRVMLKYSYPLLMVLAGTCIVRNTETMLKAGLWMRYVALASLLVSVLHISLFPGVFWYGTGRAIGYITIMIFSVALYFFTDKKISNFIFVIIFLLPCFLMVLRTSIMGSGVALMAFSIIKWRIKSVPIIVAILIGGLVAVFAIPSLHDKMFRDNSYTYEQLKAGKYDENTVDANARFAMWEILEKKFYNHHQVKGSGTGCVQNFMYNHSSLFGGLTVPHSDWVQIKCDNGLVGLFLYIAMILVIYIHCFLTYWKYQGDPGIQIAAITAGASLLGVFACMYSDNTINYSMVTFSFPFGFYGMMLGLIQAKTT